MKEWQRTIILLILLVVVIGLVLYVRGDFEQNALETLR
jgi:hypothetical protein